MAPKIRKDLNIPQATQDAAKATLTHALHAMNQTWLAQSKFMTGDNLTIADMAAYVEIGQLQPAFTNVYDFSGLDNVQRWLADMRQVEGHDVVHTVLAELGDISEQAPSMELIKNANKAALKALQAALSDL